MTIRLRQICFVAEKLAPVVEDLTSIFGLEVCFVDEGVGVFGLENSLFPVGSNFFEVVAPTKDNTAAGRFLRRRNGDGGYMVICQCDSRETQQGPQGPGAGARCPDCLGTGYSRISVHAASPWRYRGRLL